MKKGAGRGRRALAAVALAVSVLALGGCVVAPATPPEPPVAVPEAFRATGAATVQDRWWRELADDDLNALVEEAVRGSLTLRSAWARLDQAWATAARSGAALEPALTGTGSAGRSVSDTSPAGRTYASSFSLGLTASYEVDLWGGVRAARDAAVLDARASEQDLRAAAMTLAASVAQTWYSIVEQRGQLAIIDEQTRTNEQYLDVVELRFRQGQAAAGDMLQQRQLVENSRSARQLVQAQLSVLEHRLAVLLGRAPGSVEPPAGDLPELPPLPATGVPAERMRQRPDVAAAELRVAAADRRLAVAVADRFPALSLTAGASTSSEQAHDLFDNWLASLAANLTAPLLDGGLRAAEVDRTRAARTETLSSYGQTVLDALGEVEDALAREARQTAYLESVRKQMDLAMQAATQRGESYARGGAGFTSYLTALLSYQSLQRTYLSARLQRVLYRIDLYRALGGGWQLERPAAARLPAETEPEA